MKIRKRLIAGLVVAATGLLGAATLASPAAADDHGSHNTNHNDHGDHRLRPVVVKPLIVKQGTCKTKGVGTVTAPHVQHLTYRYKGQKLTHTLTLKPGDYGMFTVTADNGYKAFGQLGKVVRMHKPICRPTRDNDDHGNDHGDHGNGNDHGDNGHSNNDHDSHDNGHSDNGHH